MPSQDDLDNLLTLTEAQLQRLSKDFMQPLAVQAAAGKLLTEISRARLRAAVARWEDANPTFADLTAKLLAITEEARKDPVGDGVAVLTPIIRQVGEVVAEVGGLAVDAPPVAAGNDKAESTPADVAPPPPPAAAQPPPPAGMALSSTRLVDLAAEYVATFDAARIDPARLALIDRLGDRMLASADKYRQVGDALRIPWHFVGIVHCLEANANFGLHLHNGDSLMHRTVRVPAGRPPASVAQPPFAWVTSAQDALTFMRLNTVTDWSLPAYLYQLERYNGFGYRRRGLASPYLWSFSDRYLKGKFVKDGVFDPDAVSKQCGGAVLLKRLIARGAATRP